MEDTIGWVYYCKGIYQPSIQHLEIANATEPTAGRMYHLAMAYHKSGRGIEAQTTFHAALKMNANLPAAALARQVLGEPKGIRYDSRYPALCRTLALWGFFVSCFARY